MVVNKVGKDIPQSYAEQYGIYEGELAHIGAYQEASRAIKPVKPRETKLLGSIREAIEKRFKRWHDHLFPSPFP